MSAPETTPSFESTLTSLDATVEAMKSGNVPLAALPRHYDEGVRLARECQRFIDEADARVAKLKPAF
jgi:exodeoxyribonuclease VII small subunit